MIRRIDARGCDFRFHLRHENHTRCLLEQVLHPDLHRPVARQRRDVAEVGKRRIGHGVIQARAVQDVERLDPKIEPVRAA